MADLDTTSKRRSSVAILIGFSLLAPPLPDGTIDQGDRQHIAFSYSGILAGSPAVFAGTSGYVLTKNTEIDRGAEWRAPLPSLICMNGCELTFTPGAPLAELPTASQAQALLDGTGSARIIANLSGGVVGMTVAGQYSDDGGATWDYVDGGSGPFVTADAGVGLYVSDWSDVVPLAQADVSLRIVTEAGDGGTSLTIGNIYLEFRYRSA